jgi:hypothetical protein
MVVQQDVACLRPHLGTFWMVRSRGSPIVVGELQD